MPHQALGALTGLALSRTWRAFDPWNPWDASDLLDQRIAECALRQPAAAPPALDGDGMPRRETDAIDGCVLRAPRCESAFPGDGRDPAGASCIPQTCVDTYLRRRTARSPSWHHVILPGCYPGKR